MRVPYEWLKDFVVVDTDPHDLSERLTMRGLEVESLEEITPSFSNVVVGGILSVKPHPQAPGLSFCEVDSGGETLPIICGAKNIKVGDKVPLAKVGARFSNGVHIEKKALKGITSLGMLCSERDLCLSDDHSGIFILDGSLPIGAPLEEAIGINDFVFDINVPPNRGDCLSIYGIAREVASILDQKVRMLPFDYDMDEIGDINERIALQVVELDACPRYTLKMIEGITIVKSPYWMRTRIIKAGMRPINSVVDITNYIMLEFGQPLHAFDYTKLRERKIKVRMAGSDKNFRTLDGEDRRLEEDDLMICDGVGPVAIAGIMGGENSEITEKTSIVALESAFFNPFLIRKTARRLGIRSEASLRFEKGIDIDNVVSAAERAAYFMSRISGGKILKGTGEIYKKQELKRIFVSYGRINEILGTTIEQRDIVSSLRSIDIHVMNEEENGFFASVPPFRHDIVEYIDLIEEIARIYGYEHITATTPVSPVKALMQDRLALFSNMAKEYLRSAGFFEVINFAFFSSKDKDNFLIPADDVRASSVNILNPISREFETMRSFVAAGVLKNIAYNINRGTKNLKLFELGNVFFERPDGLPLERLSLCFALTGKERDFYWRDKIKELDFFDIKGVLEGLLAVYKVDCVFKRSGESFLNSYSSADIFVGDKKVGWIGEVGDEVLNSYGIEQKVFCSEISFDVILKVAQFKPQFSQIPRYPQTARDFSFIMSNEVPVASVIGVIKGVSPLVKDVGVFDMFKKEERSVAFRVVFQSLEDTLKDEEVNSLQEIIIESLTKIDGVKLRS